MPWLQKPPLGTPIRFDHPLAKGLVGCWLLNENGGNKAHDLSGNANHGTLTSMAFPPTTASGWNPGRFGPALELDGTNDHIVIANSGLGRFNYQNFTIESVVYIKTLAAHISLWSYDYTSHDPPYYAQTLWVNEVGFLQYGFNISGVFKNAGVAAAISAGKLYRIVATFTSGNQRLYRDSVQIGSATEAGSITYYDQEVWVGRFNYDYSKSCQIQYTRFWNRALSAQEVQQLHYEPFGMFQERKVYYFVQAGITVTPPAVDLKAIASSTFLDYSVLSSTLDLKTTRQTPINGFSYLVPSGSLKTTGQTCYLDLSIFTPTVDLRTELQIPILGLDRTVIAQTLAMILNTYAPALFGGNFQVTIIGRYGEMPTEAWVSGITAGGRYASSPAEAWVNGLTKVGRYG